MLVERHDLLVVNWYGQVHLFHIFNIMCGTNITTTLMLISSPMLSSSAITKVFMNLCMCFRKSREDTGLGGGNDIAKHSACTILQALTLQHFHVIFKGLVWLNVALRKRQQKWKRPREKKRWRKAGRGKQPDRKGDEEREAWGWGPVRFCFPAENNTFFF